MSKTERDLKKLLATYEWLRYIDRSWSGICGISELPEAVLVPLFRQWPKFSGVDKYPVPSTKKVYTAKEQFTMAGDTKWDKRTKYGRLRWELLDFITKEMYKKVAEERKNK